MSDILASIRQIMAQDPASAAPAKPVAKGVDGSPRPGVRLPTPESPRETSMRDQAPREQSPQDTVPREPAKPASPAPATPASASPSPVAAPPTPAAKPQTDAPTPAPRTPAPLAAEQPVSLDEFLALAAAPKDVITTPIVAAPAAEPVKPVARTETPTPAAPATPSAGAPSPSSDGGAPAWLFPRPQPTDDGKEAAAKPSSGATPAPPRPANPAPSVAKAETPPPTAPVTSPAPTPGKDAAPSPARAAPPAPRLVGDLGSVVPGRLDSQGEGSSRRFDAPSLEPNDRASPVGAPPPRPASIPPSRPETPRAVPAPDIAPAFETEIPGADALRRLIADVVPPSSLAPSAPAPNSDDVRTEIVLPVPAKAPDAVTVPDPATTPVTQPKPVAKQAESAPVPPAAKAAPAPKPADPPPAAAAAPVKQAPAAGVAPPAVSPTPAARTMDETVVELLRPLLRDWLNTNMPRLIEPALKAELEAMRGALAKDKKD